MILSCAYSCSSDDDLEPILPDTSSTFTVDTAIVVQQVEIASRYGATLQHFADSMAALHGGKASAINYKTLESAIRKCWTDSCQATDLKDMVRLTIACPFDSLENMITDIANTAKRQNRFYRYNHQETLATGYWGDIVNLQYPDIVSEIQIKSFWMAYGTYGNEPELTRAFLGDSIYYTIQNATHLEASQSHVFYEIDRDITGRYSEEEKAINRQANYDYCHAFWEKYIEGMTFYNE